MRKRGDNFRKEEENKRVKRAILFGVGIAVIVITILFLTFKPMTSGPIAPVATKEHKRWYSKVSGEMKCILNEAKQKYNNDSLLIKRTTILENLVLGFDTNADKADIEYVEAQIDKIKSTLLDKGSDKDLCK